MPSRKEDNGNSFRQHAIRGGYAALTRADATEIDSPGKVRRARFKQHSLPEP
jgi:hypothetical protein